MVVKRLRGKINKKTIITGVIVAILTSSCLGILDWIKNKFNDIMTDTIIRHKQVELNRDEIIRISKEIEKIKSRLRR